MEPNKVEVNMQAMEKALQTVLVEIYDITSQTYGKPQIHQNEEAAKRWFNDMCHNDELMMAQHPEDFNLYLCGVWNPITGDIQTMEQVLLMEGAKLPKGERNGKLKVPTND